MARSRLRGDAGPAPQRRRHRRPADPGVRSLPAGGTHDDHRTPRAGCRRPARRGDPARACTARWSWRGPSRRRSCASTTPTRGPASTSARVSCPARCTWPPARNPSPPASARTSPPTTRSPRRTARTTSRSRTAWTWTRMTAEIFGRETGLGRGRGGHMHLFDPAMHFSCSGIIAEGYPPALGQAFAFRQPGHGPGRRRRHRRGRGQPGRLPRVAEPGRAVEAAGRLRRSRTTTGAISVPRAASTAVPSNAVRGAAYDMPGRADRGQRRRGGVRRRRARGRAGPGGRRARRCIEVHTLRLWGHFEGDAQGYRTDLEGRARPRPDPDVRAARCATPACSTTPGRPGRARRPWRGSKSAITFAQAEPAARPVRRHVLRVRLRSRHDHHRVAGRPDTPRQPPPHHRQGHGRGDRARRWSATRRSSTSARTSAPTAGSSAPPPACRNGSGRPA